MPESARSQKTEELLFFLQRIIGFYSFAFLDDGFPDELLLVNELLAENTAERGFTDSFLAEFLLDEPEPLRFPSERFTDVQRGLLVIVQIFPVNKELHHLRGRVNLIREFFFKFAPELGDTVTPAGKKLAGVVEDYFIGLCRLLTIHRMSVYGVPQRIFPGIF